LDANKTYKIKVTGIDNSSNYVSSAGFTTGNDFGVSEGQFAPTSFFPDNGATDVSVTSSIETTFDRKMNVSTITTNTGDTTCLGTFQVSTDDFVSCITMQGQPTANNDNKTFRITPASRLSYSTLYRVKLTTGITDASGDSLPQNYTWSFSTIATAPTPTTYSWTQATASGAYKSQNTALAYDSKMWLIAGVNQTTHSSTVYNSSDGISWIEVTSSPGWNARCSNTGIVFNNRMFILGAYTYSGYKNDVWSSANGTSWVEENSSANWSVRAGLRSVVFDNKM